MAYPKYAGDPRFEPHEEPGAATFQDGVPAEFVENLREHVKKTGMPDMWPWHSHTFPKTKEVPEIVALSIDVPERMRPSVGLAPCPLCSLRGPKYFRGVLALFREEGVLRCIGDECGRRVWGAQYEEAKAEYRRHAAQGAAFEFIASNLHIVSGLRRFISELQPRARLLDESRSQFVRALTIAKATELVRAVEGSGRLELVEELPVFSGPDGVEYTRYERLVIDSQPFSGASALRRLNHRADALLYRAKTNLDAARCDNDDDVLLLSADELVRSAALLQQATTFARESLDLCAQIQALLAEANLARLSSWAASRHCPINIRCRQEQPGRFVVGSGLRETVLISRKPELTRPLPQLYSFIVPAECLVLSRE